MLESFREKLETSEKACKMTSFSCPHYDERQDGCRRIGDVCVPGRPGCVLFKNSTFAVPWQERLEARRRLQREDELRRRAPEDDR